MAKVRRIALAGLLALSVVGSSATSASAVSVGKVSAKDWSWS